MSTKTNSKSGAGKKEAPKKSAPAKKDVESKQEKKGAKAKVVESEIEATEAADSSIELDAIEEQEDAAEVGESAGQNGNAAALAAATGGGTEMSASFKNFRHHPDMENFYRFIYENDLRHEALAIIDEIMIDKSQKRQIKKH